MDRRISRATSGGGAGASSGFCGSTARAVSALACSPSWLILATSTGSTSAPYPKTAKSLPWDLHRFQMANRCHYNRGIAYWSIVVPERFGRASHLFVPSSAQELPCLPRASPACATVVSGTPRPLGISFWIRAVGIDGRSVAYEYLSRLESHLIVVEWFVP